MTTEFGRMDVAPKEICVIQVRAPACRRLLFDGSWLPAQRGIRFSIDVEGTRIALHANAASASDGPVACAHTRVQATRGVMCARCTTDTLRSPCGGLRRCAHVSCVPTLR